MSGEAASAAVLPRSRTVSAGGASRRRLRSVPAQAGPVPERAAGHPLSLGRDARARLGGAMRSLLDAAGLDGASDAVRLAVLVLASRTPSENGVVKIHTSELGRWLGMSASYTASAVVSGLRRSGVVSVETEKGEYREDIGLKCKVLPLWAAQDVVGNRLNLSKKEYATLQRLFEAVMAPGWKHRDGSVTPAGLIGTRTGRGAATDRLALLLLVLEARESGRVRQCGGTVDTRRGRAAVTVARLLGCSASAGERVLERLEARELVLRVRLRTASKMAHRTRLMVPAVAAAHGRTVADDVQEDRAEDLEPDFSDPDVTARPSEVLEMEAKSQVSGTSVTDEPDVADPDVAAALHTYHPHLVTPVVPPQLSGGFSGEGRGADGRRPGRACVREAQAVDGETVVAGAGSVIAEVDPLRGEKPKESPVDEQEQAGSVAAGAGARLTVVGGRRAQQGRPELPADLDLRVALTPVSWLWTKLSRWQQDRVVEAAKAELAQLRQVLEWAGQAPSVLATRLTSRLEETGGEALITRPYGWITRRGLVRRPSCSDVRCDDGVRLDTGADCDNCDNVLHIRKAWRVRIAAEVDQELPGLEADARYREIEARMRRHAEVEAADLVARQAEARERAAQRALARAEAEAQAAVERERAAARQAVACTDCGRAQSAGLCEACDHRRQTEALIAAAGFLAATWSTDLTDPAGVAAVAAEVRTAIEADIAAEWEQFLQMTDLADLEAAGPDVVEDTAAHNAFLAAQSAVAEYQHQALVLLGRSEEAQAEARKAYATERAKPWFQALPDSDDTLRAATQAAAQAQARTAEYLLAVRLEQLRAKALPEPVRPAPWSQRLPELAAHSLHGETLEVIA
ncbi:hypothetical protein ACFUAG_31005 [Streptomyces sp. NPDC057193]|uniref:hypothetical protein n=1 Tax=Streptomyces sp. NPDC057193 TaxID=3346043 RepID=UPI00362EE26D